jgi:hypothetical protein
MTSRTASRCWRCCLISSRLTRMTRSVAICPTSRPGSRRKVRTWSGFCSQCAAFRCPPRSPSPRCSPLVRPEESDRCCSVMRWGSLPHRECGWSRSRPSTPLRATNRTSPPGPSGSGAASSRSIASTLCRVGTPAIRRPNGAGPSIRRLPAPRLRSRWCPGQRSRKLHQPGDDGHMTFARSGHRVPDPVDPLGLGRGDPVSVEILPSGDVPGSHRILVATMRVKPSSWPLSASSIATVFADASRRQPSSRGPARTSKRIQSFQPSSMASA